MSRLARWSLPGAVLMVLLCTAFIVADRLLPLPVPLQQQDPATVVTDVQGRPLRAFADRQGIWRYQTSLDQVSPDYIEALLHYEDRWFYYHPGINPMALLRATLQNLRAGYTVSGGSTLTMQVARIFDPHPRTLRGKLHQAFRALQLEWHYSKDEILNFYLNYAPFGGPVEGVAAASYVYLDKAPDQLNLAEAALLAVLPQRPSDYRPDRHPQRARQERDKVLDRMRGVWSDQQIQQAKLQSVSAVFHAQPTTAALFSRFAARQLPQQSIIRTTLDLDLQQQLESFSRMQSSQLPAGSSIAMLVVDHRNMQLKSYIGSADFLDNQRYGHIDMVQATRSPAALLQPLLYALALDNGLIHSQSLLSNMPLRQTEYQPYHLNHDPAGPVSVRDALVQALPVPALQLTQALGVDTLLQRLTTAGIQLSTPTQLNPSIIVDGVGTSLWELVKAFSSFANQGRVQPLQWLQNPPAPARASTLVSPGANWIIRQLLKPEVSDPDVPELLMSEGISKFFLDEWAIGINPQYTLGVWVGRPDSTLLTGYYSANHAISLLHRLNRLLPPPQPASLEAKPDTVSSAMICWPLGTLAAEQNPALCQQQQRAWLLNRQAPPSLQNFSRMDEQHNPFQHWITR